MDDRITRPEISGTRHNQRPSPPHVTSVCGLSRPADQRRQNAPTGGGSKGLARRARHCARQRRAGMVVRLAHRSFCAFARRRRRAPDASAIVFRAQHLPESIRTASADADGRNFGITAGICEMLLQSTKTKSICCRVAKAWPNGSVKVCAPAAASRWTSPEGGKTGLRHDSFIARKPLPLALRPTRPATVKIKKGGTFQWDGQATPK